LKLKWTEADDLAIEEDPREFTYFDKDSGGVAWEAFRHKESQIWNGDVKDRRYVSFAGGPQLTSLMCVPIVYSKEVRGVLSVHNEQRDAQFLEEDAAFIRDLANAIAVTIAANYSDLTNLPNRRLMDALIDRELRQASASGQPLSLVFLDLDHFGDLNGRHTWSYADQALKEFAERIRLAAGPTSIVCHRHGDEFAIISPSRGLGATEDLAKQVLEAVRSKAFTIRKTTEDCEEEMTASMGVATCNPAEGEDIVTIRDRLSYLAQHASRHAKHKKDGDRNCVRTYKAECDENPSSCVVNKENKSANLP